MFKRFMNFWSKWKTTYHFTVNRVDTYEEMESFSVDRSKVGLIAFIVIAATIFITAFLINFTALRQLIPGYPDKEVRMQMVTNALMVDSLENELLKRDAFFESIRIAVSGEEEGTARSTVASPHIDYDTISLQKSEEEELFRSVVEQREKYNLAFGQTIASEEPQMISFYTPLRGVVTNRFDPTHRHYGVDVVAKQNASVSAAADGVVIFCEWTIQTGNVIQIQHADNTISVYKHNASLLKKQGDLVNAGDVIAIVGNTGEETTGPHLHFELWRAGKPINPELFIYFD